VVKIKGVKYFCKAFFVITFYIFHKCTTIEPNLKTVLYLERI
jgi:hypothetical protein